MRRSYTREAFRPWCGQWIDSWEGIVGVMGKQEDLARVHVCLLTRVFQGIVSNAGINLLCLSRWMVSPAQQGC